MPRPNKMWYRKERDSWFVTIAGKRHNLGRDKDAATKRFHQLMAGNSPAEANSTSIMAIELMDKYLLWCKDNREPGTFDWYTKHLQAFLDSLPNQSIEAMQLKPYHVYDATKKTWSASYKRGFMVAVQRAFNWAVKQGYINTNPLRFLEKPTATRRDNCPTEKDYKKLVSLVKDGFKNILVFAWESGARPQEISGLRVRHVESDRIVLAVEESKGKKEKRAIYLTEKAAKLLAKLIKGRDKDEFVFLNTRGNPWNPHSIANRLDRLAKKTGHKFALYDFRHAFATRMLEAGLDHMTVAKLLGHKDASMLARHYSHIGQKNNYLLNQLRKVS